MTLLPSTWGPHPVASTSIPVSFSPQARVLATRDQRLEINVLELEALAIKGLFSCIRVSNYCVALS